MTRIIELILRTFSLLEAEGRAAKRNALDVVLVAQVWAVAAGIAFVGAILVFAAIFMTLQLIMPTPVAAGLVGVMMLCCAVAVWFFGKGRYWEAIDARRES